MTPEKGDLSYDELVALLRTAAALQAKREFTREDLLAAADEMGIERAVAAEVVDRHLARREKTPSLSPPEGSRLSLQVTPDELELRAPPVRFGARHAVALGFLGFWFGTIAFISAGSSGRMSPLFTIPFVLAGAWMAAEAVLPLVQTTRMVLGRGEGRLERFPFGRRRRLPPKVGVRLREGSSGGEGGGSGSTLLLEVGLNTYTLLDGYSAREHRWIRDAITEFVENCGAAAGRGASGQGDGSCS